MSKTSKTLKADEADRVLRHWHEAVPNDRMAHLIKDATRCFLRALQVRLARHNVQLGHWAFLRILWQRDGLTKRELSIEAGLMEPTTFVALRAMESLGYVTLERKVVSKKNVYVYLTPAGRELEKLLVPLAVEVNSIALAGVSEADIAATRRCLLSAIDNLSEEALRLGGAVEELEVRS
ncbi:MAG: MarR family transcriptional regulator [Proteobacteria bacterium]|nr:MarR family transcriptional regulator [Pseudomonadota bacterium]